MEERRRVRSGKERKIQKEDCIEDDKNFVSWQYTYNKW